MCVSALGETRKNEKSITKSKLYSEIRWLFHSIFKIYSEVAIMARIQLPQNIVVTRKTNNKETHIIIYMHQAWINQRKRKGIFTINDRKKLR